MSRKILFSSYHNIKLQLSDRLNLGLSTHTPCWSLKSFYEIKSRVQLERLCCFSLYRIVQKGIGANRIMQPSIKGFEQAPDSEPSLTPVFLTSTCFRPPGAAQQQSGFLNFTSGSVWKWGLQWRSSGSPMERSVAHGTLIDSPRYASAWKQRKRR